MVSTPRWTRALITGASTGIGAAAARQLAAEGTDLVLVARATPKLDDAAASCQAAGPRVAVATHPADLYTPAGVAAIAQRLADEEAPVDLFVNNAGVGSAGPFAAADRDAQAAMVQLNVVAPTLLAHAAARAMVRRGKGAILTTASFGALQPIPGMATYAAGKAFMTSLSESLHEELRGTGVTVTALLPGLTKTPFVDIDDFAGTTFPDALWMTPEAVAAAGLAAAAHGRAICIPGPLNQGGALLMERLPRSIKRRLAAMAYNRYGPTSH